MGICIMKILVFNEESIQKAITTEKHILISVQDPECDFVKLPKLKSRLAWLGLKFFDMDIDRLKQKIKDVNNFCAKEKLIPFTHHHAKSILSFVNEWKDKVDYIYVNCVTGISRSAGIAGALNKILNGEDDYYFKHYIPNRYVYRLILKEYYGS
ncbi:MAG: hypothetical protein ACTSWG_13285 [Candidatus Helarchaeota archaeon]